MTDSEPKPTAATPPTEAAAPPAGAPTPPAAPASQTPTPAPQPAPEASQPAAEPDAEAPQPASEPAPDAPKPASGMHWGTGRRKSAVARVRILPGDGKVLINKREVPTFFTSLRDQLDAVAPLELTGVRRQWDVIVTVRGGGTTGQAGAVRLGLARALVKAYEQYEPKLRDAGYLTRDARRVERKKYGHRKARRRFQFSKR